MADGSTVEIKLTTTADTAGAKQTADAIDHVAESEKKLAVSADAAAAAQEKMVTRQQTVNDKIRDLDGKVSGAAVGLKNIGMVSTQVGYQVTDFAVQVQGGTSAVTALSQQLPQAIGSLQMLGGSGVSMGAAMASAVSPLTAASLVLTELVIGGKLVYDAWTDMKKVVEENTKEWNRFAAQQSYVAEKQKEFEKAIFDSAVIRNLHLQTLEAQALGDQLAINARLLESDNDLAASRGKRDGMSAADQGVQAVGRVISESQAAENIARAAVAETQRKVSEAMAAYEAATDVDGKRAEAAAVDDAASAEAEANRKLSEVIHLNANKIADTAEREIGKIMTSVEDGITANAAAALASMQAVSAQKGGKLQADAAGAMDRLATMLQDAIPDAKQTEAIAQAMQQFRGSRDAVDAGMVANFDAMIQATRGLSGEVARQQTQINTLLKQVGDLQLR